MTVSINDADANSTNELQELTWDSGSRSLGISGKPGAINLSELKDDADADPANEIQTISFDQETSQLSLTSGGSVNLKEVIAFKYGISASVTIPNDTPFDLNFDQNVYNDGNRYINGIFNTPYNGIYTFRVSVTLPPNSSIIIKIGTDKETILGPNPSGGTYREEITIKLNKNDQVSLAVRQTNGFPYPHTFSGYFSGYRIY